MFASAAGCALRRHRLSSGTMVLINVTGLLMENKRPLRHF